mmetsp:Transcript_93065/g.259262  ORF Transcript_93065/g.259262 Transcript_93065/m.259262 type:complete len:185 (+) Transcript_93065:75-629(+)|eukprot:CAMPEP_0179103652 /NCGR_PEP_ID=MMETSP0796-20121207/48039_1 /TAXON_ID=73915 /ORGANISM="Pyrodinium bahamense, Strain pbaha01" /LENGTH=184 /DNA_ID=CAMNT_0020801567 /DNA_START=61 /DNA_END=615 /DNA_ORIENTATION=+
MMVHLRLVLRPPLLGLTFWVSILQQSMGDAPAAQTLEEMLAKIESGEFNNNFFHGDVVRNAPKNAHEEVAGCLLDKVGAIVTENGVTEFVNDLQVDLAACCTKKKVMCPAEVSEAYDLLAQVARAPDTAGAAAPKVAALLIKTAAGFISPKRVKKSHANYMSKCSGAMQLCTMEELQKQVNAEM